MAKKGEKAIVLFVLAAILLAQFGLMICYGRQKAGYHIDEMYTFELSNLPGGFIPSAEGFLEEWQPGSAYKSALTAEGSTRFDYSIPYHNQENDVHPPLYYYVIHTVSSLFPGQFSKWIGIAPNIVYCLLSTVLLFLISKQIFGNNGFSLITAGMWALSVGAMDTAVFIRMYAMLTFFTLLLAFVHLRALREVKEGKISGRTLFLLLFVTACGILTQYYFLIFCFYLCGLFFFYLAFRKKWAELGKYVAVEFGAIALSVAHFPRMLFHIFGGYRGQEAFHNAVSGKEFGEHLKTVLSIISKELCNGWIKELIVLLVVVGILCWLNRNIFHITAKFDQDGRGLWLNWKLQYSGDTSFLLPTQVFLVGSIIVTTIGYILLVVKTAPYQTDRYYMCVFPFIVLAIVYFVWALGSQLIKNQKVFPIGLAVLVVAVTLLGHLTQGVDYLFRDYGRRTETLAAYQQLPVIVLNAEWQQAPDQYLSEFQHFKMVYRCAADNLEGLSNAVSTFDLSDGFLLYAYGYGSYDEEQFFDMIEPYIRLDNHELVTSIRCPVYYCTLDM